MGLYDTKALIKQIKAEIGSDPIKFFENTVQDCGLSFSEVRKSGVIDQNQDLIPFKQLDEETISEIADKIENGDYYRAY